MDLLINNITDFTAVRDVFCCIGCCIDKVIIDNLYNRTESTLN